MKNYKRETKTEIARRIGSNSYAIVEKIEPVLDDTYWVYTWGISPLPNSIPDGAIAFKTKKQALAMLLN